MVRCLQMIRQHLNFSSIWLSSASQYWLPAVSFSCELRQVVAAFPSIVCSFLGSTSLGCCILQLLGLRLRSCSCSFRTAGSRVGGTVAAGCSCSGKRSHLHQDKISKWAICYSMSFSASQASTFHFGSVSWTAQARLESEALCVTSLESRTNLCLCFVSWSGFSSP